MQTLTSGVEREEGICFIDTVLSEAQLDFEKMSRLNLNLIIWSTNNIYIVFESMFVSSVFGVG